MAAPPLAAFFEHNLWANQRVLAACEKLPKKVLNAKVAGTYGRITDTLQHMFAAEERYCAIFAVAAPSRPLAENKPFPGFPTLRRRAKRSGEALIRIASGKQATSTLIGEYQGQAYKIPAPAMLLHAINHATEHRTHIETILTQNGIEPAHTDGIDWMQDTARRR